MGKLDKPAMVLIGWLMICIAPAQAQDDAGDAPACWWEYASCARQSHGDAQWRSICYADFLQLHRHNATAEVPGHAHRG